MLFVCVVSAARDDQRLRHRRSEAVSWEPEYLVRLRRGTYLRTPVAHICTPSPPPPPIHRHICTELIRFCLGYIMTICIACVPFMRGGECCVLMLPLSLPLAPGGEPAHGDEADRGLLGICLHVRLFGTVVRAPGAGCVLYKRTLQTYFTNHA